MLNMLQLKTIFRPKYSLNLGQNLTNICQIFNLLALIQQIWN